MNAWHMSHEGGDLEDPWNRPQEPLFQLTKSLKDAPDRETEVSIDFEKGFPVAVNGKKLSPFEILTSLNALGAENGIGRTDAGGKPQGGNEEPRGVRDSRGHDPVHRAPGA